MSLFLFISQTEEKAIDLKGNSLIPFPHLKILSRPHPIGITPNSSGKDTDHVECCRLVSSCTLRHTTSFPIIILFLQTPGAVTQLLLPGPSFILLKDIQKSFKAYIIFPLCLPSTFYHSHHCIQHSMLQAAICSPVYLFL